jgi:hypothetical protein
VDLDGVLTRPGVWEMAGPRPSPADLEQQALGNKPPGLSRNSAHLNAAGYEVLQLVIEHRLRSLAWLPPQPVS